MGKQSNGRWTPLELIPLRAAVRQEAPTVVIGKRTFNLTYFTDNGTRKVRYSPVVGFVPCGTQSLNEILKDFD